MSYNPDLNFRFLLTPLQSEEDRTRSTGVKPMELATVLLSLDMYGIGDVQRQAILDGDVELATAIAARTKTVDAAHIIGMVAMAESGMDRHFQQLVDATRELIATTVTQDITAVA